MSDTYSLSQEIHIDGPSTTGHLSTYFPWVLPILEEPKGNYFKLKFNRSYKSQSSKTAAG